MSVKEIVNRYGIAPWKIDNDEENYLSLQADKSEHDRKLYVDYYKKNEPEYYKKGIEYINQAINTYVGMGGGISDERRQYYIEDMVYSLHRFGCMFDEYFMFDFEHLNVAGREMYITDKNRWYYYDNLNNYKNQAIFHNKFELYKLFKNYYKRQVIMIEKREDLCCFEDFLKKNKTIIAKPVDGSGGKGICVYNSEEYDRKQLFETIIQGGPTICEEVVENYGIMKEIHPASLNTVRISTIRMVQGAVTFYPVLRMGSNKSIVDNACSGGIVAPIDQRTGVVISVGRQKRTGKDFLCHPDSNIVLPGMQIPKWKDLIDLVRELSLVVPDNRYCGWDMALTKDGWVMIEGNSEGQLDLLQYAFKKGLRSELEIMLSEQ